MSLTMHVKLAPLWPLLSQPEDRFEETEHDQYVEGLFSRDEWLRLLTEVGFESSALPIEHPVPEPGSHEAFAGEMAIRTGFAGGYSIERQCNF